MDIAGSQLIPKPQRQTWDAICDPEVLKVCIPGCETMERISDSEFHLTMGAKVGPVSAKFKSKITLVDVSPPDAYTLVFEGQGGVAGFAKGEARVTLTPEGEQTNLSYIAKATIGGKLAQTAGSYFGLGEMESEDREFEAATTFVRLAADTVKNAASAPPGGNPVATAQNALSQAAQIHAPGLIGPPGAMGGVGGAIGGGPMGQGRSGRWIRRGNKIVLYGA